MNPVREPLLTLPLRVDADGQLARTDARDALLRLFRALAATPAGSWPHAPWFGLQQLLAGANMHLEDQQPVADALNRALTELGVPWARVLAVSTAPQAAYGVRGFRIALAIEGWQTVHEELTL